MLYADAASLSRLDTPTRIESQHPTRSAPKPVLRTAVSLCGVIFCIGTTVALAGLLLFMAGGLAMELWQELLRYEWPVLAELIAGR